MLNLKATLSISVLFFRTLVPSSFHPPYHHNYLTGVPPEVSPSIPVPAPQPASAAPSPSVGTQAAASSSSLVSAPPLPAPSPSAPVSLPAAPRPPHQAGKLESNIRSLRFLCLSQTHEDMAICCCFVICYLFSREVFICIAGVILELECSVFS